MRRYLGELTKLPSMTEDLIYNGILEFCKTKGIENLAYELSRIATVSLFHVHTLKVYSVLTTEFQSTGKISRHLGLVSSDVSSVLSKLHKETSLISLKREGKLKYWAKNENIRRKDN